MSGREITVSSRRSFMFLALLALLPACSQERPTRPQAEFQIAGRVVDAADAPIAGAAVLLEYGGGSRPQPGGNFAAGAIVEIRDDCWSGIVWTDTLAVGGIYVWPGTRADGRHCPEGRYWVSTVGGTFAIPFFLDRSDPDDPASYARVSSSDVRQRYRVQAWTDAEGRFDLAEACLAFGRPAAFYNSEYTAFFGEITPDWRARLWIYDVSHDMGRPSLWQEVDQETGAYFDVRLDP